jgi:hypothetical protein
VGSDNQLATDGTYARDDEGNLTTRGEIDTPGNVWVFAWDCRNRLTLVSAARSSAGCPGALLAI